MSDSSSSSTKPKSVRLCITKGCAVRMSSIDLDNHVVCMKCTGKVCDSDTRCDVCRDWSDEKMLAYVKHQKGLERKRLTKQKAREAKPKSDCAVGIASASSCLQEGLGLTPAARPNDVVDDDSLSSASVNRADVDSAIEAKINLFKSSIAATIDEKLDTHLENKLSNFATHMVQMIDDRLSNKIIDRSSRPISSISAPQGVQVPLISEQDRPDTSLSCDPQLASGQDQEKEEPVHLVCSTPSDGDGVASPLASKESLDALKAAGLIDELWHHQALTRLAASSASRFGSVASKSSAVPGRSSGSGGLGPQVRGPRSSGSGDPHVLPGTSSGSGSLGPQGGGSRSSGSGDPGMLSGSGAVATHVGGSRASGSGDPHLSQATGGRPRVEFVGAGSMGGDDDIVSNFGGGQPVDFKQLFELVVSYYPKARSSEERQPAPRFDHENLFDDEDPQAEASLRFTMNERLARLRADIASRFIKSSQEGKKSFLPRRRGSYRVADETAYSTPAKLNSDFYRLTSNKAPQKSSASVPLEEFSKLENAAIGLQESQSFTSWLVSTLFSYLKDTGYSPPDPQLFRKIISSLSLSIVDQSSIAHWFSIFCSNARKDHLLKHVFPSVSVDQKSQLMASHPFASDLFEETILKKIIEDIRGDTTLSFNMSMSQAVAGGIFQGTNKRKRDTSVAVRSGSVGPGPSSVAPVSQSPLLQGKPISSLFDAPAPGSSGFKFGKRGGRGVGNRKKGAARGGKGQSNFGK